MWLRALQHCRLTRRLDSGPSCGLKHADDTEARCKCGRIEQLVERWVSSRRGMRPCHSKRLMS
jgi:hypothetical protein